MNDTTISESVQNYYGQVLQSSQDLKTSACCTLDSIPVHLHPLLSDLHPEVVARYYGCGTPLPPALKGATVLDLCCGTGRDCYLLSRLVGESGHVIGIDMTEEQLAVAKEHCDWHAFDLDDHHHFEKGKPLRVCGNTYDMLASSRYADHFDFLGDKSTHFGLFDCAPPNTSLSLESGAACC